MDKNLPRRTVLKTAGLAGLALAGGTPVASAKSSVKGGLEAVYEFDPVQGQLPENVAVDGRGNKYVSISPLGQIWKFSPENELADPPFAQFQVSGAPLVGVAGLEVDPKGTVYACFVSDLDPDDSNTPTPDQNGVWRIERDGTKSPYAPLPPDEYPGLTFPNDILLFGDSLLVTDSLRGVVYRVWPDGEGEVWASGELLEGTSPQPPDGFSIGADGIAAAKDGKTVYVSNLEKGLIVRIPVEKDGSAGEPERFVGEDENYAANELFGSDGLAMDTRGNLYVAVNWQNRIARVSPSGDVSLLAEGDEFDGPSDVTFGTSRGEQKSVFITNLTDLSFSGDSKPSLMKLDVGVPGMPIHR